MINDLPLSSSSTLMTTPLTTTTLSTTSLLTTPLSTTPLVATPLSTTQLTTKPGKPFLCPIPFCIKSYKSADGLKYHLNHGRCQSAASQYAAVPLPKHKSERTHPFFCGVGSCERRYTTAGSLRYHYQNSGDHGTYGLYLIENGTHPILRTRGPTFWNPRKIRRSRPTAVTQAQVHASQYQHSSSPHT
jgi:transcription factor SFP1